MTRIVKTLHFLKKKDRISRIKNNIHDRASIVWIKVCEYVDTYLRRVRKSEIKYPCPCCGYKTFDQFPDGTYLICPVCYWEDDPIQKEDPFYEGGANPVSLIQAQKNFIEIGACERAMKKFVRNPNKGEKRDESWKPLESQ